MINYYHQFFMIFLRNLMFINDDYMLKSSISEVFYKKGVLRNFTKFKGKHLCQSLFFNKVTGLRPATLLKERLWHKSFPVNFVKFLKTPFLTKHLWWLLLYALQSLFFIMYMQKRIYQIFCRFYFDHL